MTDYYPHVELRRYLVSEGLVRRPDQGGSLPVCYVDMPDGPPPPSSDRPVVIHLSDQGGTPQIPMEGWERVSVVQVNIRYLPPPQDDADTVGRAAADSAQRAAYQLARDLELRLSDGFDFTMGHIRVLWTGIFAMFGRYYDGYPLEGGHIRGAFYFRVPYSELRK